MRLRQLFFLVLFCAIAIPALLPAQWTALSSGTERSLHDLHFLDAEYGLAVGDTSTVLLTTDGGRSWLPVASGFKEDFLSGIALGRDSLLIAGGNFFNGSLYRTIDGGFDWDFVGDGIALYEVDELLFALDDQTIYKSFNRGQGWKPSVILIATSVILEDLHFPNAQEGYALGNITGFTGTSAFGFRSNDAGDTWTRLQETDFPNGNGYTAAAFPYPDTGYVFTNAFVDFQPGPDNQLLRLTNFRLEETDFDRSWRFDAEIINSQLPTRITDAWFFHTLAGFATGADGNIYKTNDGGRTWTVDYEGSSPLAAIHMVDTETGFAAGAGGVILSFQGGLSSTGRPRAPTDIRLFPNPAVDLLTLESDRPEAVILLLRDAQGRPVRQLSFTGTQQLSLRGLPAGWYVAEMRTEEGLFRLPVIVR